MTIPTNHRQAERKLVALVQDGQWEIDSEGRIWRLCIRTGLKAGGSHLVPVPRRRCEKEIPGGYSMVRAMACTSARPAADRAGVGQAGRVILIAGGQQVMGSTAYRERRRAAGQCPDCGRAGGTCRACRDKANARHKRWRDANRDHFRAAQAFCRAVRRKLPRIP